MEEHSTSASRPTTVLHVDDDLALRHVVGAFLESTTDDLRVVSAGDATAGLERLRSEGHRVDCVLSDYDMPRVDGLAFLERVRAVRPDLPFILYTGKGSEEIAAVAIERGVDGYVRKDVGGAHFDELAAYIRRTVARSRAEPVATAFGPVRKGICIVGTSGRIEYANRTYRELHGGGRARRLEVEGDEGGHPTADHPDGGDGEEGPPDLDTLARVVGEGLEADPGPDSDPTLDPDVSDGAHPASKSVTRLPSGELLVVVAVCDRPGGSEPERSPEWSHTATADGDTGGEPPGEDPVGHDEPTRPEEPASLTLDGGHARATREETPETGESD